MGEKILPSGDGNFGTDTDLTDDGLLAKKAQELERSVILLRSQKGEMAEKDYWQQMKSLLIDLVRTTHQLKSLETDFRMGFQLGI